MKRSVNFKVLIICFVLVFGVSFIGSYFTISETSGSWYLENKPSFTPPNWLFGPVWSVIYLMIALSLYFVWLGANGKEKKKVAVAFGVNLFANVFWSNLFFGLQNPTLAFIDILVIIGSIIAMMIVTVKIDKKAMWLLVPYLLWVSFAGILNFAFI
jgi:translocator protein